MPLTSKGNKIMDAMQEQYGAKKGKSVFYASRNKGTISGVDPESSGGKSAPTPGKKFARLAGAPGVKGNK